MGPFSPLLAYYCAMPAKKLYIETYGCQMNVADSELMVGVLGRAGYERTEYPAEADVMLVNTCAVRDNAEQRVLGPERVQRGEAGEEFAHRALVEGEGGEVRERSGEERAEAAGEHADRGALHRHAAPPNAHEEQREIAGGGDGEGLADHVIDVELLYLHAEKNSDGAYNHRADFEGAQALLGSGFGTEDASVNIVREGTGHGNELAAERAPVRTLA
jgi:hypothetical protein